MGLVVMTLQSVAVLTLYGGDACAVHVKANLDEGTADFEAEESIVVDEESLGGFCDPISLKRAQILRVSPPQRSFSILTMNTRYNMYRYMTGEEMDKYLGDDMKHVDISLFGSYDKDTDYVILALCPKNCGGPLIGHIDDPNEDCLRASSPTHKALTDAESQLLVENIKALSNWNKAKLLWVTDPDCCSCDMCQKKNISLFHLYEHMKTKQ